MAQLPLLALLLIPAALGAQDYLVAPDGDDGRDGLTEATALRTIQRGAELAAPGDRVLIRAGTYRETVRPPRSGRDGAPIVFAAYRDEQPVVSGADAIVGWTRDGDAWSAPMPGDFFQSTCDQADQVFRDGEMLEEARWPDLGPDRSHPREATITRFVGKRRDGGWTIAEFEDDALPAELAARAVGAAIRVQPNAAGWGWTLSGTVVGAAGGRLTVRTRSDGGEDGHAERWAVGSRYHLFGSAALLDGEGEWIHDRAAGTLRLRSADDPARHRIEAKRRDHGFDLSERSWIVVRGLRLFACDLTSDAQAGGDGVPYAADGSPRFPWRPAGFVAPASHLVAPASHLVVEDVRADYVSHFTDVSGHFFLQWTQDTGLVLAGSDHEIRRCTVRWSAGNGISLQGVRHRCIANTVLDTDYAAVDCAAISTGPSSAADDLEIAWNTVRRCGRSALALRGMRNSDPAHPAARVHHNDVADWLCQDWDGGAFYVAGMDGRFTRIDHNRFHCEEPRVGMVFGAYFDYSKNYVLDHNLIWGVPVAIQVTRSFDQDHAATSDLLIYRNTAVTDDAAWGAPLAGCERGNGSVVRDNIFRVCMFAKPDGGHENGWPIYGDGDVTVGGNLVVGGYADAYWTKEKRLRAGDRWAGDAGFVDAARHDFRLREDSPARDAGTPFPRVERDGVVVEPYEDQRAGAAYDLGAIERGGAPFAAGADEAPR